MREKDERVFHNFVRFKSDEQEVAERNERGGEGTWIFRNDARENNPVIIFFRLSCASELKNSKKKLGKFEEKKGKLSYLAVRFLASTNDSRRMNKEGASGGEKLGKKFKTGQNGYEIFRNDKNSNFSNIFKCTITET